MKDQNITDHLIIHLDSQPNFVELFAIGFSYVLKFSILLICPVLIANYGEVANDTSTLISLSLLVAAITTIFIASRKIGTGCFLPVQSSVPYFAASLIAVRLGGLPVLFGMSIFSGIMQCILSPLQSLLKKLFNHFLLGLILILLGLWAGLLGVNQLFHPQTLGNLLVHGTWLPNNLNIGGSLLGDIHSYDDYYI